jgi:hypothetical protein
MANHFHKGNRRRWEAVSASWARRANMRGIWRKYHRDPSRLGLLDRAKPLDRVTA